eukprot:7081047-Pyramimonas_sp.AAC.1
MDLLQLRSVASGSGRSTPLFSSELTQYCWQSHLQFLPSAHACARFWARSSLVQSSSQAPAVPLSSPTLVHPSQL